MGTKRIARKNPSPIWNTEEPPPTEEEASQRRTPTPPLPPPAQASPSVPLNPPSIPDIILIMQALDSRIDWGMALTQMAASSQNPPLPPQTLVKPSTPSTLVPPKSVAKPNHASSSRPPRPSTKTTSASTPPKPKPSPKSKQMSAPAKSKPSSPAPIPVINTPLLETRRIWGNLLRFARNPDPQEIGGMSKAKELVEKVTNFRTMGEKPK